MWWINRSKMAEEAGDTPPASGGDGIVTENTSDVSLTDVPADSSTEESVNWAGMSEDLEKDDEAVEGDSAVIGEKEPEAPAPEVPPGPEAVPPVAAPVLPTPAQPAPVVAPREEATPEEYQTWRTAKATELQASYAISDDDAAALLTEPEVVLPKLMANAHMMVLESSMRAMQAMMPVMMQEYAQTTERNTKAQGLFTSINPDLADPSFEPAIMQLGQVYRKVNPTAGPEEASRAIGALVRSALNITAAPAAAASPAQPAPLRPAPFTPARGGGGGNTPVVENEFTRLANEFLKDD